MQLYKENLKINYQDIDYSGVLKLSCLLEICSNIATAHAIELGVWSDDLIGDYGWILAKMHIEINKPVHFSNVELLTYPGIPSKVIYPRYYQLVSGDEILVKASSIWTLLDLKKRRITIPKRAGINFPVFDDPIDVVDLPEDIDSENIPYQYVETRKVQFSDVDTNQHMNNARYIEWACDLMDYSYFKTHYISMVDIFFKHEIVPSSLVDLYFYKKDEDIFYIKGSVGDIVCFEIKMNGKLK